MNNLTINHRKYPNNYLFYYFLLLSLSTGIVLGGGIGWMYLSIIFLTKITHSSMSTRASLFSLFYILTSFWFGLFFIASICTNLIWKLSSDNFKNYLQSLANNPRTKNLSYIRLRFKYAIIAILLQFFLGIFSILGF